MLIILFIILFLYNIQISNQKLFFNDFLSLKQTNSIKGVLALTVLLHHYSQRIGYSNVLNLPIQPFLYAGYLCVSVFFFYSGYGLIKGLETKQNYFNNFLKNKIIKILIPFILINSIYTLILQLYYSKNLSYIDIFQYIFGFKLINSNAWYIWGIMYFYFSFYFSFKYLKKKLRISFLFLLTLIYIAANYLLGNGLWWYDSCSTFLFGIIYYKYNNIFFNLSKKYYFYLITTLSILFFAIIFKINTSDITSSLDKLIYLYLKHFSTIIFVSLVILFLMKFKIENKFTILLGKISFEFYLIHKLILDILRGPHIYIKSNLIYAIFSIILTTMVSIIINYIINNIFNNIYSNKKSIK